MVKTYGSLKTVCREELKCRLLASLKHLHNPSNPSTKNTLQVCPPFCVSDIHTKAFLMLALNCTLPHFAEWNYQPACH